MVKKINDMMDELLGSVRTVHGTCPECEAETLLVSVVTDYYRCCECGEDTKQYVNGSIKYLRLTDEDHEWLRKQKVLGQTNTPKEK